MANERLNEYVGFLNALNQAEIAAVKIAAGPMDQGMGGGMPMDPGMGGGMPMDPAMGGGMPMDPAMGGGMPMDPGMGGGMPMDPAMGGGMPMDPGMALGIPGGVDPAALGLAAPGGVVDPEAEKAEELADKALIEKSLEVSNKAMDLAQAQSAKVEELLDSMGAVEEPMPEPEIAPEELEALLEAKAQGAEGMI